MKVCLIMILKVIIKIVGSGLIWKLIKYFGIIYNNNVIRSFEFLRRDIFKV